MTAYRVYHARGLYVPLVTPLPRWPDDYRLVAEVQAAHLQGVFHLTNSHRRHWSEHPGVICHDAEARSTSVGDVAVSPEGTAYRCEGVGWSEL